MSGKTELKIFDDHPPQVVVEAGFFEDIHPRTSLDDSNVIEFYIPASNVDYLDLNDTLLTLQLKIVKSDGTSLIDTDQKPVPSNFFMHSLFSNISVSMNDTIIEGGSSLYPYKAGIECLLSTNKESRATQLGPIGYGNVDERQKLVGNSSLIELTGALRLDFLNQPKYLIPGVNVRIVLTKSTAGFAMSYKAGETEPAEGTWKIVLSKALLYVRRVKVHPTILKAHQLGLQKQNAIYPYTRGKVVSFAVPQGSSSFCKDNLFSSALLPKIVVIGLVRGAGFTGTIKHRSLCFKHYDLTGLDLLRDGQCIPYRTGYHCDFAAGTCTDVYVRSILQNLNVLNTNHNCALSLDEFKIDHCLFVFNLTPDFDMNERQTVKDSNLRLDLTFNKALTDSLNVVAYAAYDTTLQITKNGEIIRDGFA
jgi:hypothetical protein